MIKLTFVLAYYRFILKVGDEIKNGHLANFDKQFVTNI